MPNAQFQAQSISITLPIGLSTATTPQTWIWTILASQASIISFYRAQLPQMGWSHLTFEANGDGPALSVCGTSPQNTSEILEVEAANTISGTDIANVIQTYTAPTNGAVFVIGIIPTTSCASVI